MNIYDINMMEKELNALKEKANNLEAMITAAKKEALPVFNRKITAVYIMQCQHSMAEFPQSNLRKWILIMT